MSSLNRIILIGVVASEPELKATNAGDSFLRLSVKVERISRLEETNSQSDYIPIVAWRERADQGKTLKKGDTVLIDGRIITRSYDTPEGKRKWITEVEARELRGLAARKEHSSRQEEKIIIEEASAPSESVSSSLEEFKFEDEFASSSFSFEEENIPF